MIDKPEDCPLCGGTGYKPVKGTGYAVECDHTYLSYRGKVFATGNGATLLLGAILAAPVCIIIALLAVLLS